MKIMILAATTGAGHMRAAQALKKYILESSNSSTVEVFDTLECISPLLNKTITESYENIAKKVPKLFGSMYKSSNSEKKLGGVLTSFLAFVSKWLIPIIYDFQPDVIISTHPFSSEMVSDLREEGKIDTPHICILTDYEPHLSWINKNVDSYIVASSDMIDAMVKMGAPREKIHPFGIPIDGAFYLYHDKKEILKQLNFKEDKLTILIMAGSFGVNDILKLYESIVKIDLDFQVIVITGRNQALYKAFEKKIADKKKKKKFKKVKRSTADVKPVHKKRKKRNSLKLSKKRFIMPKQTELIYFTNEVEKYMKASDLIVTKPGGLTVSEALACNLPMAIFNSLPGPESGNAEFLIENNMAVKIEKGKSCTETITKLLKDGKKLRELKNSCEAFDKSQSGKDIFMEIEKLVNNKNNSNI